MLKSTVCRYHSAADALSGEENGFKVVDMGRSAKKKAQKFFFEI